MVLFVVLLYTENINKVFYIIFSQGLWHSFFVCSDIYIIFLGCLLILEERVLSVLFSTSDNVRGEYAEELPLG